MAAARPFPRALLALAALALLAGRAAAHSSGVDACSDYPPQHGTVGSAAGALHTITLLYNGAAVTSYVPGAAHTLQLGGTQAWKGFAVASFVGSSWTGSSFSPARAGTIAGPYVAARAMSSCPGGMTQPSATSVTAASGIWTAPAAGTGPITFYGVFVVSKSATHTTATITITEGTAPPPTPSPSPSSALASPSGTGAVSPSQSGSGTPTPTPSGTVTPTPSPTPSNSQTPSNSPSISLSPSGSNTPSTSASPTGSLPLGVSPSITPSISTTPSPTPSITPSNSGTPSPTPSMTASPTPTPTPTPTSSPTPTATGTQSPSPSPTVSLSPSHTALPSPSPCSRGASCSGAGACPAVQPGKCTCDAGYTGDTCTQCWSGFAAGLSASNASVCVAPPALDASRLVASLSLRLLLDFASVAGANGSATRTAFTAGLLADFAAATGAEAARFSIASLASGSILVGLTILPPLPTSPAGAPSAAALAAMLQQMAGNSSSALLEGVYTSKLDASFPPAAALAITPAAPASFVSSLTLAPGLVLQWRLDLVGHRLFMRLTSTIGGWASVGFNSIAGMIGTDAFLVEPAAAQISLITIPSYDGVTPVSLDLAASTVDVLELNFTAFPGGWTADFSRMLAQGAYPGALSVPASGNTQLIAAWGAPGEGYLRQHATNAVTMGAVNLATGAYVPAGSLTAALRTTHAVFMAIAWAVLVPAGIAALRYGKAGVLPASLIGEPLQAHMRMQCGALLFTLMGFAVALAMVPVGRHFATSHSIVGLAVVVLALLQPVLGLCCSPPAHRIIGWVSALLAVTSVFLGLQLADPTSKLSSIYGAAFALTLVIFALLERRARFKGGRHLLKGPSRAKEAAIIVTEPFHLAGKMRKADAEPAFASKPALALNPLNIALRPQEPRRAPERLAFAPSAVDPRADVESDKAALNVATPASVAESESPSPDPVTLVAPAAPAPAPASAPAPAPASAAAEWVRVTEAATGDVWFVRGAETVWTLPAGAAVLRDMAV